MTIFRRRNQAPVAQAHQHFDASTFPRKNLVISNAQISLAEVELVPRFVVHINGIPQRPARESDMHLRIQLRQPGAQPSMTFSVSATELPRGLEDSVPWNETGLEGLLKSAFEFFDVRSLSKLNGRLVRILTHGDQVCAIGDYLEDRWFTRFGYQPNSDALFHSMQAGPDLLTDHHNSVFRCGEVYVTEGANARIKVATMVPGKQFMEVVVKLADVATRSRIQGRAAPKEIVVRYRPSTMEQLSELLSGLCEVGGVSQLERLNGRLVRFEHSVVGDVSFSGAEREAARHFYLSHPVRNHSVDMAPYNGTKEIVDTTN